MHPLSLRFHFPLPVLLSLSTPSLNFARLDLAAFDAMPDGDFSWEISCVEGTVVEGKARSPLLNSFHGTWV